MSGTGPDPIAACDALIETLERALALELEHLHALDDRVRAPLLLYAAAQLRMRVRPALSAGWPAGDPVHVVPLGGTNSGKSTVVNLLLGRPGAGMHVTARHTQHPIAFRRAALDERWLRHRTRFAGYEQHFDELPPRQSDEELRLRGYRPALAVLDLESLAGKALGAPAAPEAIVWDVPDFSTEEAQIYLPAVVDTLGLADLVLPVVTDQSYADDRAMAFLRMVRGSGVPVRIVANKLPPDEHLVADIAAKLSVPEAEILRLPDVREGSPEERWRRLYATAEAARLREAVAAQAARGAALKRAALRDALGFLGERLDELLRPLSAEAALAQRWRESVERLTRKELVERYEQDYLQGAHYGEFNQTLVKLMDLLHVPGVSDVVNALKRVVGIPLQLAREAWRSLLRAPDEPAGGPQPPEGEILGDLVNRWLDRLRAEAQTHAETSRHPGWQQLAAQLASTELRNTLLVEFAREYKDVYRPWLAGEVEAFAHGLYRELQKHPVKLNSLRAANLAVNAAAVALVIKSGGIDWSDAVVGPIVSGLVQRMTEEGMGGLVEVQRARLKRRQLEQMDALVRRKLAEPLAALYSGAATSGQVAAAREQFDLVLHACLAALRAAQPQQEEEEEEDPSP